MEKAGRSNPLPALPCGFPPIATSDRLGLGAPSGFQTQGRQDRAAEREYGRGRTAPLLCGAYVPNDSGSVKPWTRKRRRARGLTRRRHFLRRLGGHR